MARLHTLTEIEIRLFERPRKLPFRGRSFKTLSAFLRREAKRSGPWMERIANVVETLGREGGRYRRFTGKALILAHHRPNDREGGGQALRSVDGAHGQRGGDPRP